MKRRQVLQAAGVMGANTIALSGVASGNRKNAPTARELEAGEIHDGRTREDYIRKALKSYRGSDLDNRVSARGYQLNQENAIVIVGRSRGEETVYVCITISSQRSQIDLGSNYFPGLSQSKSGSNTRRRRSRDQAQTTSEEESINLGHFIWSDDEAAKNIVLIEGGANRIVPEQFKDWHQVSSASATEFITNSKHTIDVTVSDAQVSAQSTETPSVVEHVSIDMVEWETERSVERVSPDTSSSIQKQDTGCPSSFTSALVTLIGCAGSAIVCVGLLGEPATTVVTCAAAAGCGTVTLCCVGAAAPDSYCSAFGILRYTAASSGERIAAQIMYDGCQGKSCVPVSI